MFCMKKKSKNLSSNTSQYTILYITSKSVGVFELRVIRLRYHSHIENKTWAELTTSCGWKKTCLFLCSKVRVWLWWWLIRNEFHCFFFIYLNADFNRYFFVQRRTIQKCGCKFSVLIIFFVLFSPNYIILCVCTIKVLDKQHNISCTFNNIQEKIIYKLLVGALC